ncbi:MAG: hypothetical protein E7Z86_01115 [Methanosphaera stadtmanae]|nr:hypothetical protein [Methanosphaera stadtmanae]
MAGSIASIFIQFDNPFEDNDYRSSYSNNNNSTYNDYSNYSNSRSNSSKYSYNRTNQSNYYNDNENLSVSDRIKIFINEIFGDK